MCEFTGNGWKNIAVTLFSILILIYSLDLIYCLFMTICGAEQDTMSWNYLPIFMRVGWRDNFSSYDPYDSVQSSRSIRSLSFEVVYVFELHDNTSTTDSKPSITNTDSSKEKISTEDANANYDMLARSEQSNSTEAFYSSTFVIETKFSSLEAFESSTSIVESTSRETHDLISPSENHIEEPQSPGQQMTRPTKSIVTWSIGHFLFILVHCFLLVGIIKEMWGIIYWYIFVGIITSTVLALLIFLSFLMLLTPPPVVVPEMKSEWIEWTIILFFSLMLAVYLILFLVIYKFKNARIEEGFYSRPHNGFEF